MFLHVVSIIGGKIAPFSPPNSPIGLAPTALDSLLAR